VKLLIAILALLAGAAPVRAADWVVSVNLCTDQLLLLLAPEKIAALSNLSVDPTISFVAAEAGSFPQVRASAEAVLKMAPDLVLAGTFGAQTTLALLEARGIKVVRVPSPRNFDEIRGQLRFLADLLEVPERGEQLEDRMDALLATAPHRVQLPVALMWGAGGWSAGPDSLGGAVLRAAGMVNASSGGRVPLEAVAANPPDLIVLDDAAKYPALATGLFDHPALRGIPRITLPPALLICGGPFTALAVQFLSR